MLCRAILVRRQSSAGWLLVGLIVLISAVLLALVGITFYLTEHLRTTSLRQNQTRAIYLAQAGVMQAIYDFRFNAGGNAFTLGTYDAVPGDAGAPGLADDNVFILGGRAADFLLAAMIPSTFATASEGGCGGAFRHRLNNWTLRNVVTTSISFTQMAVSWSPVGAGEYVVRVYLNGTGAGTFDWPSSALSCGSAITGASGTTLTLNSTQTIPSATFWGTNRIVFATTNMNTKTWIELAFSLTDGSTRRVRFVPGIPTTSSANFTIKSIGEVREGAFPFSMWRRLQAEYRLNDDDTNVSNLQEVGSIVTDGNLVVAPAVPAADERPGYRELPQQTP